METTINYQRSGPTYSPHASNPVALDAVRTSTYGTQYAQSNAAGYQKTRGRSHVHDYHGANAVTPGKGYTSMKLEDRLWCLPDGTLKQSGQTFLNSASSPYWPLPPRPYCDSLYEDIAAVDRPPAFPIAHPLPGEHQAPPELQAREDQLYLAQAESTLRRQTTERLMEQLPEMQREQGLHHLKLAVNQYAPVMTASAAERASHYARPASPSPWAARTGLYVAAPGVTSVGFQSGDNPSPYAYQRTPVDTSARLLRSYMASSEPSFAVTQPGFQATRVGTLASEAPLSRHMGPIGEVQGLMHDVYREHNVAARYAQVTKNMSIGRNPVGASMHQCKAEQDHRFNHMIPK